jgi:nucleoside-diphosphate-sugar epimerase
MRILMTGHNGYIGSVMAPWLERAGHEVTGLDTDYFADCRLIPPEPSRRREIRKDLRDVDGTDLKGFDAVIHLAALSNDPIGNQFREFGPAGAPGP